MTAGSIPNSCNFFFQRMAVCDSEDSQKKMNAVVLQDYKRWSGQIYVIPVQKCQNAKIDDNFVFVLRVYSRCIDEQCTWWCGLSDTENEGSWVNVNTKEVPTF